MSLVCSFVKFTTRTFNGLGGPTRLVFERLRGKTGDGMANHHLIPEELMKAPAYKPIPAEVLLSDGSEPAKRYNFFCIKMRRWALDQDKSVYALTDEKLLHPQEDRGIGFWRTRCLAKRCY